jgi:folate-binding Fe-S cluster repair protein YgfZ
MTFSPVTSPDSVVRWSRLSARGEDATTFLQGQLSCDVTSLAPRECVAGLLLAPTGDVITSLVCQSSLEGIDLVVRQEIAGDALTALRRFLLRTKCEFLLDDDVPGPYASVAEQVRLGEPGPAEFSRHLSAHSFGMGFVAQHVSFTKGCFTGQELVGRLDARGGNVPFRLGRVSGEDIDEMENVVRSAGPSGERGLQGLTTIATADSYSALAVVHRTLLGDALEGQFGGVRVELLHGTSATED